VDQILLALLLLALCIWVGCTISRTPYPGRDDEDWF